MSKLSKIVISLSICLIAMTGYSQSKAGVNVMSVVSKEMLGLDVLKSALKTKKDTTFSRYFNGSYAIDSTRFWKSKRVYTGTVRDNNTYEYNIRYYEKNAKTGIVNFVKEELDIYKGFKFKNITSTSKQYLINGLVEEIITTKNKKSVRCFSKEGTVLNENGCLRFTQNKFNKDLFARIQKQIQQQFQTLIEQRLDRYPYFILVNIEANKDLNQWFMTIEFSKEFVSTQYLSSELKLTLINILNKEPLTEDFFNKDINGNYYNNTYAFPISFVKGE